MSSYGVSNDENNNERSIDRHRYNDLCFWTAGIPILSHEMLLFLTCENKSMMREGDWTFYICRDREREREREGELKGIYICDSKAFHKLFFKSNHPFMR